MEKSFDWGKTMVDMTKSFGLSKKEVERIEKSPVFKIIAAIPYLAKCEDADRLSYINLSAVIVAARLGNGSVFSFRESDLKSLDKRLECISNFKTGNKKVIKNGMNLVKLAMLGDYQADLDADAKIKKLNPITAPKFNLEKEKALLNKQLLKANLTEFDAVLGEPAKAKVQKFTFWIYD